MKIKLVILFLTLTATVATKKLNHHYHEGFENDQLVHSTESEPKDEHGVSPHYHNTEIGAPHHGHKLNSHRGKKHPAFLPNNPYSHPLHVPEVPHKVHEYTPSPYGMVKHELAVLPTLNPLDPYAPTVLPRALPCSAHSEQECHSIKDDLCDWLKLHRKCVPKARNSLCGKETNAYACEKIGCKWVQNWYIGFRCQFMG